MASRGEKKKKHHATASSQINRCPIPPRCSTQWRNSDPNFERAQLVTVTARSDLGAQFRYDHVEFCRYPAPADWAPALLAANRSSTSAPTPAQAVSAPPRPPLRLAACTMFRSTLRRNKVLIVEWVAYHRLQGVEHFYVYANEDPALSRAALAPYIAEGLVDVVDWRWNVPRSNTTGWARQHPQLHSCIHRYRGLAAWVALFDADEFFQVLLPPRSAGAGAMTLRTFLDEQSPMVGALAADMFYFAECGVVDDSTLVTQACALHAVSYSHKRGGPAAVLV